MRSLAKPMKPKQNQQKKQGQKKQARPVSKKVVKTVFNTPFRYKIQALSLQDGDDVNGILINYAQKLRVEEGISQQKMQKEKIIRFESKVIHDKPPLTSNALIFGVKNCTIALKKRPVSEPLLIVIFYEQSIHDRFQELMCNILYHKRPYIVLRQDKKLNSELGLKKILALGITRSQLEAVLLKYSSRCLIEIPWLVDNTWIPLDKKK